MKTREEGKRIPVTIHLDPDVRQALRLRKAVKEVSLSDTINDAVRKALKLPIEAEKASA